MSPKKNDDFLVKLHVSEGAYRRMPFDGPMGRDLADALTEVRTAFERENEAKRERRALSEVQLHINHRKAMEERAVLLFRTILSGIPDYCASNPIIEQRRGRPEKGRKVA